jgi:hypothetical protein
VPAALTLKARCSGTEPVFPGNRLGVDTWGSATGARPGTAGTAPVPCGAAGFADTGVEMIVRHDNAIMEVNAMWELS